MSVRVGVERAGFISGFTARAGTSTRVKWGAPADVCSVDMCLEDPLCPGVPRVLEWQCGQSGSPFRLFLGRSLRCYESPLAARLLVQVLVYRKVWVTRLVERPSSAARLGVALRYKTALALRAPGLLVDALCWCCSIASLYCQRFRHGAFTIRRAVAARSRAFACRAGLLC